VHVAFVNSCSTDDNDDDYYAVWGSVLSFHAGSGKKLRQSTHFGKILAAKTLMVSEHFAPFWCIKVLIGSTSQIV